MATEYIPSTPTAETMELRAQAHAIKTEAIRHMVRASVVQKRAEEILSHNGIASSIIGGKEHDD